MSDLLWKLRVLRHMVRSAISEWREYIWRRNPDAPYCCDGRECGCGGMTLRELWTPREPQT